MAAGDAAAQMDVDRPAEGGEAKKGTSSWSFPFLIPVIDWLASVGGYGCVKSICPLNGELSLFGTAACLSKAACLPGKTLTPCGHVLLVS